MSSISFLIVLTIKNDRVDLKKIYQEKQNMEAKLIVLAGLPEQKTIKLNLNNGEDFIIGRSVECNLSIGNIAVSREHCRIFADENGFWIEDLESHNGISINDLPVKNKQLEHRDRITFGNACAMFITGQEDFPQAVFDDGSLKMVSTAKLLPHYKTDGFSPDLNVLIRLGRAINEIKHTKKLQSKLLEIILEFIPAERGAIVFTDKELSELKSICVEKEKGIDQNLMQISRTVCRQVLKDEVALISNDLTKGDLSSAESLNTSEIKSLLCVPLKVGLNKGLVYLDSKTIENRFTDKHLEQMIALSYLISAALENAESLENLQLENEILKDKFKVETEMIGESNAMQKVYHLISKFAQTDSTVLITGKSGTGKELAAKAIHQNSPRKQKSFIAINCAVLSKELLESELFGYEKGAFTGATSLKKGKIELAEGGTIFLDEIGELEPDIQAKLLRFLQEKEFERVGGTKSFKADVRILAATNRDLVKEVDKGVFRQDLFYRLNILQLKMPALAERKSDIPLLTQFFIRKYSEKCNRQVIGTSNEVKKILNHYEWKGNVRELENIIERSIVLGESKIILPEDLPTDLIELTNFESSSQTKNFHQLVRDAKQQIILKALKKADGNYSKAAEQLSLHPNNLHRTIRNLNLKDKIKQMFP